MLIFGVCFVLYFIKLSAGIGFWAQQTVPVFSFNKSKQVYCSARMHAETLTCMIR